MIDQWNEQLRCPQCWNTGLASLSLTKDDRTPTVLTVPHGFKVIQTEFGPDFDCASCNVRAEP